MIFDTIRPLLPPETTPLTGARRLPGRLRVALVIRRMDCRSSAIVRGSLDLRRHAMCRPAKGRPWAVQNLHWSRQLLQVNRCTRCGQAIPIIFGQMTSARRFGLLVGNRQLTLAARYGFTDSLRWWFRGRGGAACSCRTKSSGSERDSSPAGSWRFHRHRSLSASSGRRRPSPASS